MGHGLSSNSSRTIREPVRDFFFFSDSSYLTDRCEYVRFVGALMGSLAWIDSVCNC